MEFNRLIFHHLSSWYGSRSRRSLLLRGARQVGKSFSVRVWAREQKLELIELNFEEQPRLRQLFEQDLVIDRILDEISLFTGKNPRRPNTILFFDEVQAAPQAITALRYFYEKASSIPIIAAGSLIEFVLEEKGLPVGRVESMYLHPLSFFEFLEALGKSQLRDFIISHDLGALKPVPNIVHEEILSLLRLYYQIGGMPKVIATYLETRNFAEVSHEHSILVKGYRDDFEKYGRKMEWNILQALLSKMGILVGRTRVKFAALGQDFTAAQVRRGIDLMNSALLINRVYPVHTTKIPLAAASQQKYFKLLFLDIGLLHHLLGFDWRSVKPSDDLTDLCEGRFAEQFVGQEIVTTRSGVERYQLHYWDRPKSGSDAEVDYVIEYNNRPTPLEVKSGMRGKLRSLNQYLEELEPSTAFVLSQRNCERIDKVTMIPLYFACRL